MKILIISDIHGNYEALDRVMKKAEYDVLICCGDLVVDYPFPEQCVNALKNKDFYICSGNNDYIVAHDRNASDQLGEKYAHYAKALDKAVALTKKMVSDDAKRFLLELPREHLFFLDNIRFYMNHTVPRMPIHHYLDLKTPLADIDGYYKDIQADVILTGHTHIPYIKKYGDKILINPGSVGEPRDRDTRASFATFDTHTGQIELHRLEYDYTETRRFLKEMNFPNYTLFCLENGFLSDNADDI